MRSSTASIHISPMPVDEEIGAAEGVSDNFQRWLSFHRFVSNYKTHIFWLALYQIVVLLIFAERAYCEFCLDVVLQL